ITDTFSGSGFVPTARGFYLLRFSPSIDPRQFGDAPVRNPLDHVDIAAAIDAQIMRRGKVADLAQLVSDVGPAVDLPAIFTLADMGDEPVVFVEDGHARMQVRDINLVLILYCRTRQAQH